VLFLVIQIKWIINSFHNFNYCMPYKIIINININIKIKNKIKKKKKKKKKKNNNKKIKNKKKAWFLIPK